MNDSKKEKFKMCFFGEYGAGKKSLIRSLIERKFYCTSKVEPELHEEELLVDGKVN